MQSEGKMLSFESIAHFNVYIYIRHFMFTKYINDCLYVNIKRVIYLLHFNKNNPLVYSLEK